jgi:N-methylhydantoinase B
MTGDFDPISLEIMWGRLISIANQGAATLLRTAFSTVVGSTQDFKFILADPAGGSIALSDRGAIEFVVTFPKCLKSILKVFPADTLSPGDVIVTNDPWLCAGHYNDIHIATPVFHGDKLVAFAGSVVHLSDIGGRYGAHNATEYFEEGICLPVLKLYRAGVLNMEVLQILEANVRSPEIQLGDVRAMLTANEVGGHLLVDFMDEYQLDSLSGLASAVQSLVERAMRGAIEAMPDGIYEHETWTDAYQVDVHLRSRITVAGDTIRIDWSGSSPQTTKAAINCVLNMTEAMALPPFKSLLTPHIPVNEGAARPIQVYAPEGSIVNARRPAALYGRSYVSHALADHIMGSLAGIVPDRILAESSTRWMLMADRAPRDGKRVQASFFQAGSMAAAHHKDGPSGKFFPIMAAHTPVELFERTIDLVVASKELRPDSGGAGRFRGGCSQQIKLENMTDTRVDFSCWLPRVRHPANGVFGGKQGAAGYAAVNDQPIDTGGFSISPGDEVVLCTPAGGGFGDPLTRRPERVVADVIDGYVSIHHAREDYGVVVEPESLAIDERATVELRTSLAAVATGDSERDKRASPP